MYTAQAEVVGAHQDQIDMQRKEHIDAQLYALDFPVPTLVKAACHDDRITFQELQTSKLSLHRTSFEHHSKIDTRQFPSANLVFFTQAEDYERFAALTLKYCLLQKAQSKRYDQPLSVYDYWQRYKKKTLAEAVISYTKYNPGRCFYRDATDEERERELVYRLCDVPTPHLFPITLATSIMCHFRASRVLDLSAGWGDRALAACALNVEYYSVDPNSDMQEPYRQMMEEHGTKDVHTKKQRQIIRHAQFECDIENPIATMRDAVSAPYDLLFSSPPFFVLEEYSKEESQSIIKYPTLNEWVRNFLLKSLWKANQVLASGAHIVLHLSDIRSIQAEYVNTVLQACCDTQGLGWQYRGTLGYTRCKGSECKLQNGTLICQSLFWMTKP